MIENLFFDYTGLEIISFRLGGGWVEFTRHRYQNTCFIVAFRTICVSVNDILIFLQKFFKAFCWGLYFLNETWK